jgi:hypothetical protein
MSALRHSLAPSELGVLYTSTQGSAALHFCAFGVAQLRAKQMPSLKICERCRLTTRSTSGRDPAVSCEVPTSERKLCRCPKRPPHLWIELLLKYSKPSARGVKRSKRLKAGPISGFAPDGKQLDTGSGKRQKGNRRHPDAKASNDPEIL